MFIGKTSVLILTVALSGLAAGQTSPQQTSGSPSNAGPNNAQVCGSSSCSSPASNSNSTWRWDGSQWTTTFSPGQAPTLGPSFSDYLNNLTNQVTQTLSNAPNALFQAVEKGAEWESNVWTGAKNNPGGAIAAGADGLVGLAPMLFGDPVLLGDSLAVSSEPIQLGRDILAPAGTAILNSQLNKDSISNSISAAAGGTSIALDNIPLGQALYGGAGIIQSLNDLAEQGEQINHPPVYSFPMPYFDPLEPVNPPANVSASSLGNPASPFVFVNPQDVTIVDPPASSAASQTSGTDILEIDDSSAQLMLQSARQSQQNLLSEQQQLMSQSADYQQQNELALEQSQEALQQSVLNAQNTASRLVSNNPSSFTNSNSPPGDLASLLQSFGGLLNVLAGMSQPTRTANAGRLSNSTKTGRLSNPTKTAPVSCSSPIPEEAAACNLVRQLTQMGVVPGSKATAPNTNLGGVTCHTNQGEMGPNYPIGWFYCTGDPSAYFSH